MASSSATRCRIRIRAALPRVAVENRRQLGRTIWEKAEALISVAHPDFREELIREADKLHIWRRSNKI